MTLKKEIIVKDVITCKTNTSFSSDKEGRRLFERLFGGSETLLRSNFKSQKENTITKITLSTAVHLYSYQIDTNFFISTFSYSCLRLQYTFRSAIFFKFGFLGESSG